tara:strand:+ start:418 stop:642 length:225 start_codon:yes stop_codon:yes gene_type:complete
MLFIQASPIKEAINDENKIQYQTYSIGLSKTLVKYNPRGALIRITLTRVIISTGVPLPSPCMILLLVIPIVTNG